MSCQACCFAATGAIFAAIDLAVLRLVLLMTDAAVLYCCGAILRRCTSVFASSMPGLIAYFGPSEFKSFQPLRDPILPEAGLGQRARLLPGCRPRLHNEKQELRGCFLQPRIEASEQFWT